MRRARIAGIFELLNILPIIFDWSDRTSALNLGSSYLCGSLPGDYDGQLINTAAGSFVISHMLQAMAIPVGQPTPLRYIKALQT